MITPELVRKHIRRLVEATVDVDAHAKRSSKGKAFRVRQHKRTFKNGDIVYLAPEYAGSHSGEKFRLSQWDPDRQRGWIGDLKTGSGWYVTAGQITKKRPEKDRRREWDSPNPGMSAVDLHKKLYAEKQHGGGEKHFWGGAKKPHL